MKIEILKDFENTTLDSSDRCLTYKSNFLEDNILYQLCLNISLMTPYYFVYVLRNNIALEPYRWLSMPERKREDELMYFQAHINIIKEIMHEMQLNEFPENLAKKVISDINYEDVEMGTFTYFNAFFMNYINL